MSSPFEKPLPVLTDDSGVTNRLISRAEDGTPSQSPSPPYHLEVLDKKRSRLAWAGAATAGTVVTLTGGIATAFIGWILARRFPLQDAFEPGLLSNLPRASFIVAEGEKFENDGSSDTTASLRALTISALASQIVAFTNSFVMGLVAYRTAGQWLEHSEDHDVLGSTGSPSPVQYGILVTLLGNPSYASIARATKYALRKTKRSPLPRLFIEPLIFAVALYVLTHAIGLADLWLHSTARSILVPIITPDTPAQIVQLTVKPHGFAFNQTVCDLSQFGGPLQPCTHDVDGWTPLQTGDPGHIMSTGMLVAYNASEAPYTAITLASENSLAILTPNVTSSPGIVTSSSPSAGTAFLFATLGARASCTYLNDQCVENTSPAGAIIITCATAGWPEFPLNTTADDQSGSAYQPGAGGKSDTRVFSVRDGSIGKLESNYDRSVQQFPDNTWSENPATIGIQLSMPLTGTLTSLSNVKRPLADPKGFTYVVCSLAYFNVTANYNPISNSYSIIDATPSTQYFTSVLLEPLISQLANERLMADAQIAILIGNNISFNALISQDLARMAVAWNAGMFTQVPATSVSTVDVQALGVYPMAPVITITLLLYFYAILALSVFFTSRTFTSYNIAVVRRGDSAPGPQKVIEAVALGQKWLTNPIPLVAMAFPEKDGWDGRRSVAPRTVEMIEDRHGDRLVLGIHSTAHGEPVFGLRKRGFGLEMRKRSTSF